MMKEEIPERRDQDEEEHYFPSAGWHQVDRDEYIPEQENTTLTEEGKCTKK